MLGVFGDEGTDFATGCFHVGHHPLDEGDVP